MPVTETQAPERTAANRSRTRVVAFDARSLGPKTRHWGVGTVIENVLSRLRPEFKFVGLAPSFPDSAALGIRTWPRVPRANFFLFEMSTAFAGECGIYWGTNHLVPALCRQPSVLTVHDLLLLKFPNAQPHSRLLGQRMSSSVRRASRILTDSKTTADDLIAHFPQCASKVEVALLGFDAATDREQLEDQPSEPYVVMLGAHHPRKNLELAIAVVRAVRDSGRRLSLIVTNDIHPRLQKLMEINADLVKATGPVPKSEVFGLLRGAQAMLFPSLYEGFGFPLLEAMAAGCPVLALNTPINREIAGEAACFLPSDSGVWAHFLIELLQSSITRDEMVAAGKENIRRFSWGHTTEVYADAFRNV